MKCEVVFQNLFNIRVCSDGSEDETLEWVKIHSPSGTEGNWDKWDYVKYPNKKPVECSRGGGCKHYMFGC